MSDTAKLIQVIETTLSLRGNGKNDPFRRITQYWSTDGTLLAEVDPYPLIEDPINGECVVNLPTGGGAGPPSEFRLTPEEKCHLHGHHFDEWKGDETKSRRCDNCFLVQVNGP